MIGTRMTEITNIMKFFVSTAYRNPSFLPPCFEDLIAREGIAYESMPFSEEKYPHALRTQKECFCNAYHLALYEKNLTYVEGYIFFIIPIMHAWCVDECGYVVDPTIEKPEDHPYLGIPMDIDFVAKTIHKKGTYGVIDDYQNRFPLLDMDPSEYIAH